MGHYPATPETSYYTPLANLLNDIGKTLKPRVRCIINLQNRGAGLPDGGLFTLDQLQRASASEPLLGQLPARGAIEVKSTSDDAWVTADGSQVSKYWGKYRQVLVTNYRDFVLVGQDLEGHPVKLESYRLAESEATFWAAAAHPRNVAETHNDRLTEYLKRVMRNAAPLTDPQDVAWFLASHAREARACLEQVQLPALASIRRALEEALAMTFEGPRGEHFFRSTLVQTLFYGVFAAWILWSKQHPLTQHKAQFDWRTAAYYLRVPVLRKLFHEMTDPGHLVTLHLDTVLDWAGLALNRVDRAAFFARFEEGQAVQYFYEPFLKAFDPVLRKRLGVWYTPVEIVQYMVKRVDAVLREEFGIADGLADPRVYVLDPCCGTGAYLVEVLRCMAATMQAKGADALFADDLKRAAMDRVFGFEILPAPFVVSHLQLGLLLQNLGVPLSDTTSERVGVYLTNALTGWESSKSPKTRLLFPELEEERDAAEKVKREVPILVILGNPPYDGFAGVAVDEERDLSNAYRTTTRAPAPQGQGLNDLYVRFFRMAERRIVEKTGQGVVCFISNYAWLDGLSFTGMRERYLEAFDTIWIDNLHGDRIISEYAPDGRTSETIFAMQETSTGIKVGTAISLLIAKHAGAKSLACRVLYRDMQQARAAERRAALLTSLDSFHPPESYICLEPVLELGLPLKLGAIDPAYLSWALLPELFPVSFPGVKTSRDDVVVDIDRDRLVQRMQQYFDPSISHEEMRRIAPGAIESTARFNASAVRTYLLKRGFLPENIVQYCYRPFDVRWLYWEPETKLLDEKRAEYFPYVFDRNIWIVSQQKPRRAWSKPQVVQSIGCLDLMDRSASYFPLYLRSIDSELPLLLNPAQLNPHARSDGLRANVSDTAVEYLTRMGLQEDEENLFYHTIALLHAPRYHAENSGALRQDWPRIPLPATQEALMASAQLGREVAALLNTHCAVSGVTVGSIRAELRVIAMIAREGGGALDPAAGDLAITAGWGYAGKGGITMPVKGKVIERQYSADELDAIRTGSGMHGLPAEQVLQLLGETTCDVYLNAVAYWRNIPVNVWAYTLGGYQVIKKWLSYRERNLLGRSLTTDEAREVMNIARRIAALVLLSLRLDANYKKVIESPYAWPGARTE